MGDAKRHVDTLTELHIERMRYLASSELNLQLLKQIQWLLVCRAAMFKVLPNAGDYWIPSKLSAKRTLVRQERPL